MDGSALRITPLSASETAESSIDPVGDREALTHQVRAVLTESGLSYRDQEAHSGVSAAMVYDMAHNGRYTLFTLQRFAAFAVYRSKRSETQTYWRCLLDRLVASSSRYSVIVDAEGAQKASPLASTMSPRVLCVREIADLYSRLSQPENQAAAALLLQALCLTEATGMTSPNSREEA